MKYINHHDGIIRSPHHDGHSTQRCSNRNTTQHPVTMAKQRMGPWGQAPGGWGEGGAGYFGVGGYYGGVNIPIVPMQAYYIPIPRPGVVPIIAAWLKATGACTSPLSVLVFSWHQLRCDPPSSHEQGISPMMHIQHQIKYNVECVPSHSTAAAKVSVC